VLICFLPQQVLSQMLTTAETLAAMRREIQPLLETAMEGLLTKACGVLEEADQQRIKGLAEVAEERAKGLAEVAEERAKGLADIDARRAELGREVATMQKHKEAQEGRVELNVGGYNFQTSVQTLRRVPHTFFDAYFSGRYAQDVCNDGSIFVDRDGEHFGHVLEYMRDGCVSVAESGMHPSVSLLRALKREFGFYCIELVSELEPVPVQSEVAYVIGGYGGDDDALSSMERYDTSSGQWSEVAAMATARSNFTACVITGEIYVAGGKDNNGHEMSSVEKYSPSSDTWIAVTPLPEGRSRHAAVSVGSEMYVMGGFVDDSRTASVLKFDSTRGTFSEIAPMPEVRFDFAACAVGSDIFVFGGYDVYTGDDYDSVFKLDTVAKEWSTLMPMPHALSDHSASVLDSLVYIVGASDSGLKVLRFDPVSGAWSTLAPTASERNLGAFFGLGGYLYAAGGYRDESSVERYDVASNTWEAVVDMLEGRVLCSAVTIGSAGPAEERDLFDSLIAKASCRRP
jgi:hypothetical protein